MVQIAQGALVLYGLLLIAGGAMGKAKGSSVSLAAGGISGLVALFAYYQSLSDPETGFLLGGLLGLLLTGVFINRFVRTRKLMPAGLILILSLAVGVLCMLARQEVVDVSLKADGGIYLPAADLAEMRTGSSG